MKFSESNFSRRDFIKLSAVGLAVAAGTRVIGAARADGGNRLPEQLGIQIEWLKLQSENIIAQMGVAWDNRNAPWEWVRQDFVGDRFNNPDNVMFSLAYKKRTMIKVSGDTVAADGVKVTLGVNPSDGNLWVVDGDGQYTAKTQLNPLVVDSMKSNFLTGCYLLGDVEIQTKFKQGSEVVVGQPMPVESAGQLQVVTISPVIYGSIPGSEQVIPRRDEKEIGEGGRSEMQGGVSYFVMVPSVFFGPDYRYAVVVDNGLEEGHA